jgi:hypothetical protein
MLDSEGMPAEAKKETTKMKQNVTEYDFVRSFDEMNRGDNFSRAGRFALFEYLEEVYGEDYELDVIGVCCSFDEYTSLEEYNEAYGTEYEEIYEIEELVCSDYGYDNGNTDTEVYDAFIVHEH